MELTDGLDVACEGEEGAMHPLKCIFSTRKMVSISWISQVGTGKAHTRHCKVPSSWTLPGWHQWVSEPFAGSGSGKATVCFYSSFLRQSLIIFIQYRKRAVPTSVNWNTKMYQMTRLVFTEEFKEEISCSCCWMKMANHNIFNTLDLIIFEIRKTLFMELHNSLLGSLLEIIGK